MSIALQFKLTLAGQSAVWNASNTGTALNLTHVQFGSGNRTPSGSETALLVPQQTAAIAAGFSVSGSQIRMSAIFSGSQSYVVREVGLWAGDPVVAGAKLIAYWSQASGDLANKSPGVDFIFSHDMVMDAAVPAGSLTILADNAQSAMLSMIAAHEAKLDPHPQYTTDAEVIALIEARVGDYVASTNVGNAYAVVLDPVATAYTAKTAFAFKASAANTGATTLNAGGGVKALVREDGSPMVAGDILSGAVVTVVFDTATDAFRVTEMVASQIASASQRQAYTAFATSGAAPTFIGTAAPAITSYSVGQRFRVSFHAGATGASTMNLNGLGARLLKQYDYTGAKVSAVIAAGQLVDVEYDGTDFVLLDPLPGFSVQPGEVQFFAMSTPPAGYLKANGAAISRTTYAALFAVIGTTFGAGDGATTFTLPDLRGEFLRGFDDGRGVDSGRTFGSWQNHDFLMHTHLVPTTNGVYGSLTEAGLDNSSRPIAGADFVPQVPTQATGGGETRPRNVALLACIKY
ncbi:MAG: tail fiber protein [Rhodocyclales bacterium]|nr:tail fiber protein [Rhodocyclales bacterium]